MADHPAELKFDVFLSHNSKDKPAVIALGQRLQAAGLRVWLDVWDLCPGHPWQEALEEVIKTTRAAAVLVGADGMGPWEDVEMRACLDEFVKRKLPVIPVLLPDCPQQPDGCPRQPELPLLLRAFTWVDLRDGVEEEGIRRLLWGITGKKPEFKEPDGPVTAALDLPEPQPTKEPDGPITVAPGLPEPRRNIHHQWKLAAAVLAVVLSLAGVWHVLNRANGSQASEPQNPTLPDPPVTTTQPQDPDMVALPGGEFWMWAPDADREAYNDEKPRHKVTVKPFSIDRYEITREEYAAFIADSHYAGSDDWRKPGFEQSDKDPVVNVSFNDAQAYADWLNKKTGKLYRLPTGAEWEYAARAGTGTLYFWGNNADEACIYANTYDRTANSRLKYSELSQQCEDGYEHTAPVGWFKPNAWGLYDMLGNVWEWTCSGYANPYNGAENRCGTVDADRVVRGGSWLSYGWYVRKHEPDYRINFIGFRLALDSKGNRPDSGTRSSGSLGKSQN